MDGHRGLELRAPAQRLTDLQRRPARLEFHAALGREDHARARLHGGPGVRRTRDVNGGVLWDGVRGGLLGRHRRVGIGARARSRLKLTHVLSLDRLVTLAPRSTAERRDQEQKRDRGESRNQLPFGSRAHSSVIRRMRLHRTPPCPWDVRGRCRIISEASRLLHLVGAERKVDCRPSARMRPCGTGRRISMKTPTTATTKPMSSTRVRMDRVRYLLAPRQVVTSPETLLSYEVERFLGEGGFGQVFLARRAGRSSVVDETVCVKISTRIDGWLREAYFGQLLDGHPRAIKIFDAFPLLQEDGRILYCLALEFARHGDLRAYLHRTRKGWPERHVRREIAGILEVLGKLHRGHLLHRDLTPMNVFVCEGPSLKLGDFGIVRQQSDRRGITARTMNTLTAPSDILERAIPRWQARDDVYQVG